ncbi:MAG: hypothetical protein KatS3mg051_2140 [Anaerolineae bacterium]|nr:MAG: hypothetical protein KatS3mg051_2140 [Anaerolineae bacterium]
MARRYYCDIEGLEENWVEVDERWTRREFDQLFEPEYNEQWLDWLHRKVVACHIRAGDVVLDDPGELTEEALLDADLRLWGFLGGVLIRAAVDLRNLGNVSGRLWSATSGAAATATKGP